MANNATLLMIIIIFIKIPLRLIIASTYVNSFLNNSSFRELRLM